MIAFFVPSIQAQIVIYGGDATEALDSVPSDHTIGNPCGVPNFMNIFYNGDYVLPGDLYMQDAILTIYGSLDYNGYNIYYMCDNEDSIVIEETLSVTPIEPTEELRVYPNPTNGMFHVNTDKPYSVLIYDMTGKLIGNTPDLRDKPSGMYLTVITIDNKSTTKKIIKN